MAPWASIDSSASIRFMLLMDTLLASLFFACTSAIEAALLERSTLSTCTISTPPVCFSDCKVDTLNRTIVRFSGSDLVIDKSPSSFL